MGLLEVGLLLGHGEPVPRHGQLSDSSSGWSSEPDEPLSSVAEPSSSDRPEGGWVGAEAPDPDESSSSEEPECESSSGAAADPLDRE